MLNIRELIRAIWLGIELAFILISASEMTKGGEKRKWLEFEPKKIVETKTITVEPLTLVTAIKWNEDFLSSSLPMKEVEVPSVEWQMEGNDTCAVCKVNWASVQSVLPTTTVQSGISFSKIDVPFNKPLPVWNLYQDGQLVRSYPGQYPLQTLLNTSNLLPRKSRDEYTYSSLTGTVDAGTIDKTYVEETIKWFVKFFGRSGTHTLPNIARKEPVGPVNVDIPAKIGISWLLDSSGKFTVNLNPKPVGRWGLFSQSISSIVYDGKGQVRFVTPLSALNPVLTVK